MLEAAADLLDEGGLAAATMEAVASRAGVSKVTIYKWWPSRGAVAIDAYFRRYEPTLVYIDSGDLAGDLAGQLRALIEAFQGRAGRVMAELVGASQEDPDLARVLRDRWLTPRREATAGVLQRAVDRGELVADLDVSAVLDQLYGPVYYRLLLGHESLTSDLADVLLRGVLDGARPR